MEAQSLDQILGTFDPNSTAEKSNLKTGAPVTIWLPPEYKAKYDQLQKRSNREFIKKLREIVRVAIDVSEAKFS